jgi:two-component system sensor histidine kinase LytS
MDVSQLEVISHWLINSSELMQRVFVIMMVAYLAIRLAWLRQVLRGIQSCWQHVFITALFFGVFAIIGSHNGLLIDIHQNGRILNWSTKTIFNPLQTSQAIISFRDLMALSAGLTGGIWVGFGAGLLAGIERGYLGGFAGVPSGIGTMILGLMAGLIKHYFPLWIKDTKAIICIAIIATVLQKLILIALIESYIDGIALAKETFFPLLLVNCGGCLIFTFVLKDLERDQLRDEKRQAELLALHAQVEPHFLNNTLTAIQELIYTQPDNAHTYLAKLAIFFNETRENATLTLITIEQELFQVQHYIEFQQLRFQDKIYFDINVPMRIFDYQLPPRSLQTLIENALTHGRKQLTQPLTITISGRETENKIILRIEDNGCGIAPERLALLTKQLVKSTQGNGTALYYLKQSLLLAFRGQAQLVIKSHLNQGTVVIISFPKELSSW